MQCKQCGNELGAKATFCPCGWQKHKAKSPYADAPRVACHSTGCGISAMCKIQTAEGWINVCWQHYERYYFVQARDNCAARGLHTTAQLRNAFRLGTAILKQRVRNREVLVQREPGEDWDEKPIDEAAIAEQHALAARIVAGEVGPESAPKRGVFDE